MTLPEPNVTKFVWYHPHDSDFEVELYTTVGTFGVVFRNTNARCMDDLVLSDQNFPSQREAEACVERYLSDARILIPHTNRHNWDSLTRSAYPQPEGIRVPQGLVMTRDDLYQILRCIWSETFEYASAKIWFADRPKREGLNALAFQAEGRNTRNPALKAIWDMADKWAPQ